MKLNDVVLGRQYVDRNYGLVRLVAFHCDDGSALIVEVWDKSGNEFALALTEACFLHERTVSHEQ